MANDFHFGSDMMVFQEPSCQNNDSDSWSDEDSDEDEAWKERFNQMVQESEEHRRAKKAASLTTGFLSPNCCDASVDQEICLFLGEDERQPRFMPEVNDRLGEIKYSQKGQTWYARLTSTGSVVYDGAHYVSVKQWLKEVCEKNI
mmetsp:Transcript_11685/g.23416  ORF Transcript_11685/g.23416 Transcript_11685/m.23416 type:complete len:145 (+) Transcript_11685:303-737(+)|eukprot:CAMPEP_0181319148 /NCGR_PEP_ID=MMETSP1101-20121128/17406_1 /TAXON_ID=46948 /ORGANISM="Rhodomonas abbreviata, Strain Caron Lab Isolate" /LENGTH=144 /DNA_ID=CAMNT_0023426707 /DNA_START=302 /DNA_END=736 /DNA_ORIENTATION=+